MERSRAVLLTLVCVLFSRISGAEVEMRVRPGDNVILYCDCVRKVGIDIVWFRKSSDEDQAPLIISGDTLIQAAFSRYCFVWNPSIKTHDLLVKNISKPDLGLYYCAFREIKSVKDETGAEVLRDVYHYVTRTTRLSLLDSTVLCADSPQTPSTPPVSDCSVCWKLLVCVCPVCVLLSSVVSSTCMYWIYRNRTKGEKKDNGQENEDKENQKKTKHGEVGGDNGEDDGVAYTLVNIRGQNRLKRHRVELSDICTYSEVKHGQT